MLVSQSLSYSQVGISAKKIKCVLGKGGGEGAPRPDLVGVVSKGPSEAREVGVDLKDETVMCTSGRRVFVPNQRHSRSKGLRSE